MLTLAELLADTPHTRRILRDMARAAWAAWHVPRSGPQEPPGWWYTDYEMLNRGDGDA